MAYKKLVINGEEFPLPSKVSDLENDVGYLKESSDSGAFINYGEGYAVNIGASTDVSIASGGNVYLNGRNGTVVNAEEGEIAADFSNQRIANIADPEADTDGVNKKYVDDAVKGIDIPDVSVPTKVSQLENDADYLQNNTDMVITAPHSLEMTSEVVKLEGFYGGSIEIDTEGNVNIAGDAKVQSPVSDTSVANKGYVDGKETAHNTSSTAHNDIRQLISGLTSRLNAVANSDDTTLDQLSEIVAYIKANKSLIDSITTSKLNVSDIIDNLTTSVSNKPLSAKMGVELKKLIDAITIPTTLPASDVYSWAKQPTKPTYTAEEVGAIAKNQGSANVGKILVVGSDGNLMLTDMPTGISDVTGVLDEDFNILLSGDLADGTYTLRYKNTDGSYSDAVTLVVGEIPDPEPEEPQATNWIPNSINADGTPFVGANGEKGYKTNTRMSISSGNESTSNATDLEVTGFIPIKTGDTIYLKGITIDASSTTQTMVWYNSSFQLSKTASSTETSGVYTGTVFGNVVGEEKSLVINASAVNNVNFNADVAYIRITAGEINADSVINIMRDGQWT